jgi:hypothetical protein
MSKRDKVELILYCALVFFCGIAFVCQLIHLMQK